MAVEKTLELIHSLDAHDRNALEKYLKSPFFNAGEELLKLYRCLSEGRAPTRQAAYSKLFPGKRYDDKKYRYLSSELNSHLEKFLMLRTLHKDRLLENTLTAKALAERDLKKSYNMLHKEITAASSYRDEKYFLIQYEHGLLDLGYYMRDVTRKQAPDYSVIIQNLDTFYLLAKLRIACETINLSNILKGSVEIGLFEKILEIAGTGKYPDEPLIAIYLKIYRFLSDPRNEADFHETGSLLRLHGEAIKPSELGELYQYLKNYCIRRVNSGNTDYVRVLFNLYNDMLGNKSLMRHDYLSQWEFKNMVTISLRLGETGWCEKFLKKYINHLRPADRRNALTYNTAYLNFMKGNYRQAIRQLQDVEMNDVFYQLDSRVIILKSYYELDETDAFFYQASAFRLFLMRNKSVSEFQKTIYRNLIKYICGIERSRFNRKKLLMIRSEIESGINVADLSWLLNKVNEALEYR